MRWLELIVMLAAIGLGLWLVLQLFSVMIDAWDDWRRGL